jgi:hypothetical protein
MNGDFTRLTFQPKKSYSSVRLQQGRVQLDADWNEQVDIQAYHDQTTTRDVVGPSGAPHHRPEEFKNFEIRAAGQDIEIAGGRIYVDGILCENDDAVTGTAQPNLTANAPKVRLPDGTPDEEPAASGTYLAYLDVWQRSITALEDPSIREDALGGPDTAVRTKTIWQVLLLRVGDESADVNCLSSFPEWDDLIAGGTGTLRAQAQPEETSDDPCLVPPGGGYRGLENQLYRVEIHEGGPHGTATFKWSRDNGAIVTEWLGQDGNRLIVGSAGRDASLGFTTGQWVELTDETRELQGLPGVLVRLTNVEGRILTIDPGTTTISRTNFPVNPKVRRWDLPETGVLTVETPTTNEGYLPLEDGVEVRFEPGDYRSGDYWQIPARTLKADIEWPQEDGPPAQPAALEPHGIRHHFCRLALIEADEDENLTVLSDCRRLFPPLTEVTGFFYVGGDGQEALPGDRLRNPLQAGVANGQWPVAGAPVRFTVGKTNGTDNGNVEREDGSDAGRELIVETGADGVAMCYWRPANDQTMLSQQVTATLLDDAGGNLHLPIHFGASLSLAQEVGYTPGDACTNLEGVTTVQEALDELCKTGNNVQGIHIKDVRTIEPDTPLLNDTSVPVPLLVEGLRVVCDTPVDEVTIGDKPTCFVTLDLPFPFNDVDKELWGEEVVGYQPLILRAEVKADDEAIVWTLADEAMKKWLLDTLFERMAQQERGDRILTHLTLKGNFIWAKEDPALYLDGDAFGVPTESASVGLDLPSGDNRRGGDFEMWFWLEPETPGLKSLTISQAVVTGGGKLKGTVTLSGRAGSEGTEVTIQSNNPAVTVPQTVTVPPGAFSTDFDIDTTPVGTSQNVTITASLEGSADQMAPLTVQPPRLSELKLNVSAPTGLKSVGGTVTLNGRTPAGGLDVKLSSDNTQVATVPGSVKVTGGQTSATFTVTTVGPGQANITGTLGESRTANLKVLPQISTLQLTATKVIHGKTVGGTVTLASAVPFEVRVTLASTNSGVATVPQNVVVPANAQAANFTVSTTGALGVVGITASLEGSAPRSETLVVLPRITALAVLPSTVEGGQDAGGRVTLESAPPFTVNVVLSSSNTGAATVPASVDVVANTQIEDFTISTGFVTQNRAVTISAFYSGVESRIEGESQRTRTLTVIPFEKEFDKPQKDAKDKTEGPFGPIGPIVEPFDSNEFTVEPFGTGRAFISSADRPELG